MKWVFASKNEHKVSEIRALLPDRIILQSLNDIGWEYDIEETGETLEANAVIKAKAVFEATGMPCFADDSGLEVVALNGRPGVHSARFAGPEKSDLNNCEKLLSELKGLENRKAKFKTVIAYVDDQGSHLFAGEVHGSIIHEFRGTMGFGYDPLFVPDGWTLSFAEVTKDEKNRVSHRAKAFEQFLKFLATVEK
ncbi:MAG: RdgB/HAM1 family non-canonical purine NTP pyrophosphatase [Bacteroidota bacterium]